MTEKSTSTRLREWLPAIVLGGSLIAAGSVGQFQLGAMAAEQADQNDAIEENEESIEEIQRQLIRRQGEIGLDLERLRIEQNDQSEKLDQVLDLLREQSQ